MKIKRKIYEKLIEWKNSSNGTKALLIEGARRIGKSRRFFLCHSTSRA